MSRLSKLYQAMETLREEGLRDEDLERKVSVLEENIIKNEILPIVTQNIEPSLAQVQRELVLVVDYHPGEPIRVSLSRKRNISQLIDDAKLLEIDPEVEHGTNPNYTKKAKVEPKTNIRVVYQGKTYESPVAAQTFVEVIEKIGVSRVRSLGLTWCKIPLISTTEDKKYSQQPLGPFFVITHSSSEQKQRQLYKIGKELGIDIKVDVIAQDGSIVLPSARKSRERKPSQEQQQKKSFSDDSERERYFQFVASRHKERTAQWYLSVLNKQVREYIARLVDSRADSIFSYKTSDEVKTCIELLMQSEDFMADNKRQKNAMTAALNKYHLFLLSEENKD